MRAQICIYLPYVSAGMDGDGLGDPAQTYEGDSICNEIVPINQKVLYLYALQLLSQKGLLLGYTTAKSQLSSSFTTLHNPLSRKSTKLHCDMNLSSVLNSEYCMS